MSGLKFVKFLDKVQNVFSIRIEIGYIFKFGVVLRCGEVLVDKFSEICDVSYSLRNCDTRFMNEIIDRILGSRLG